MNALSPFIHVRMQLMHSATTAPLTAAGQSALTEVLQSGDEQLQEKDDVTGSSAKIGPTGFHADTWLLYSICRYLTIYSTVCLHTSHNTRTVFSMQTFGYFRQFPILCIFFYHCRQYLLISFSL